MFHLIRKVHVANSILKGRCFGPACIRCLQTQIYDRNRINVRCGHVNNERLMYDIVVVGGGIVGTATARQLLVKYPELNVALVEKESELACHQTGHNSGVIHAGMYYIPGTLRAKLCVKGLHMMYDYCRERCIPHKTCGKLIVATSEIECKYLKDIYERAKLNNVPDLKIVDQKGIKKLEPNCKGLRAIWSPHTGIVDYALVTNYMACDFKESGGDIFLNYKVSDFKLFTTGSRYDPEAKDYPLHIIGDKKTIKCKYAIVCAGLQSDRLAVKTGCKKDPKIIPVRGEYNILTREKAKMVCGNIYPVPDPKLPFLGVHFTPRMDGSVWLGPNAVLALKREGYKWRDINLRDLFDAITYPGFIRLSLKNFRFGINEVLKSAFLGRQIKVSRRYIDITKKDIRRGPTGVRALALDRKGNLIEEFVFDINRDSEIGRRVLHCRNAPSPAATSSLAIAELIVKRVSKEFCLDEI